MCPQCQSHPDCRIVAFDFYFHYRLLEKSVISLLSPVHFYVGKSQSSYLCLLLPPVLAYAERRRTLLLTLLAQRGASPACLTELRTVDLQPYYNLRDTEIYSFDPLLLFCGRDERTEVLDRSLAQFTDSWPLQG